MLGEQDNAGSIDPSLLSPAWSSLKRNIRNQQSFSSIARNYGFKNRNLFFIFHIIFRIFIFCSYHLFVQTKTKKLPWCMFTRSKHLYSNQISGGVSDISSYQILTELIKERCLRDLHLVVLGFHLFVCIASGRSPGRLRLLIRRSEPEPRGPTHGSLSSQLSSISELRGSRRGLKLNTCLRLSHCLRVLWDVG